MSNTSIPIRIPGDPSTNPTDANFTGRLESPHLLPVPQSNGSYGGTPEQPAWFYNRTLGDDDIVCGTSNWTVRRACCPRSIGIMNGDDDAGANCRMHDDPENSAFWMNCTRQIGEEYGAGDVQSTCWSLQEFMDARLEERKSSLASGQEAGMWCSGLAQPSGANNYTTGTNYTDVCCAEVGGKPRSYASVTPDRGSISSNRSNWMAMDCDLNSPNDETKFVDCMNQYTWAACNATSAAHRAGASAVVIAAAALALLV